MPFHEAPDHYQISLAHAQSGRDQELHDILEGIVDGKSFVWVLLTLSDIAHEDNLSGNFYKSLASDLERLANKYEGA